MSRAKKPELATRYGKLLVLSEFNTYGRRIVKVECDCGKKKEVHATSLIRGATTSCGASTCRPTKVEQDKQYHPNGVTFTSMSTLQAMWNVHTKKGHSGAKIAENAGVNANSLYAAFRAIRKCGGWEAYARLVSTPRA